MGKLGKGFSRPQLLDEGEVFLSPEGDCSREHHAFVRQMGGCERLNHFLGLVMIDGTESKNELLGHPGIAFFLHRNQQIELVG